MLIGVLPDLSTPAFAADGSFNVGSDDNAAIVSALTGSSYTDTITLSGSGTVTLETNDTVMAAVAVIPAAEQTITIEGGDFRGLLTVTGEKAVLSGGVFACVSITGGSVTLLNSTVSNANHVPLNLSGASTVKLEHATVQYTGGGAFSAIGISGNVSAIAIDRDSLVTSTYCGIGTENADTKTIGVLSVSGNLHGNAKALSIGQNTTLTQLTADNEGKGHIFANGGSGIAIENVGGTIVNLMMEENTKIEGTVFGLSNSGGSVGTIQISGLLSGVLNVDGVIDSVVVLDKGKILGERTAIQNQRSAGDTRIGTINVKSGGQIWGKGINGSEGIGIANAGGTIQTVAVESGGYVEGGQSGSVKGYGIFSFYNGNAALIESISVDGIVGGMEESAASGGIGIYNRASTINSLVIGESGQVNGRLAGVLNNVDQAKAEIKNFTLKGKIFSETSALVNAPSNNSAQAIIGSESFQVDFYSSGQYSLLRGKTNIGSVGIGSVSEIAPIITYSFSPDNKTLSIVCKKEDGSTPVYGMPMGLFCLEDGMYTRTGVTDTNGKWTLNFASPFATNGKTWWIYNFAHYDASGSVLYSSTKVPNISPNAINTGSDSGNSGNSDGVSSNIIFKIIKNADGRYTIGDGAGYTFTCDGKLSDYLETQCDGQKIPDKFLVVASGSTIITIKAEYLKGLAKGQHTIKVVYKNGYAQTNLTISKHKNPQTGVWQNPFADVSDTDWFYEDIRYACQNGIMHGVSGSQFAPTKYTTRGMIVTLLYRLAGEPQVGDCPFEDVAKGSWYEHAVTWATENRLVSGYDKNRFGPEDMLTREQMAVILYSYAQLKGMDVTGATNIAAFDDADKVSAYALPAMTWAIETGILRGVGAGILSPGTGATRAQTAAVLNRFSELP